MHIGCLTAPCRKISPPFSLTLPVPASDRKLDELAHKGRPITARDGIDKLAEQRMPRYRAWADYIIDSRDCAANTAHALLDTLPPAL